MTKAPESSPEPLLSVRNLQTHFRTEEGLFRAVDGVSFEIGRGQTLGVVGESGCGKSVTALTLMGLVPQPPGEIAGGEILFDGRDLLKLGGDAMRQLRGDRIAMIFQEPMTSLNPVYTVGEQITEAILAHRDISADEARRLAIEMLEKVRIPAPEKRVDDYPHHMSGGMRQRVMIAMALACAPDLLIADEPTTALDVTIQAQILDLMRQLKAESNAAILLITHDLGVVAELVDHVVVMYAGKVVESAPVADLFADPQHPYTIGLLGSIPRLDEGRDRLAAIEGRVPSPYAPPPGCRFNPRCPFAIDRCREESPPLTEVRPGSSGKAHLSACWRTPLEEHVL